MAGLVPAIHVLPRSQEDVDARPSPGMTGMSRRRTVMAGLVPAIHVLPRSQEDVDARPSPGMTGIEPTERRHGRACPGHPRLATLTGRRGCPAFAGHDEE